MRKEAKKALEKIIAVGFSPTCFSESKGKILVGKEFNGAFHIGPKDKNHGFLWSHLEGNLEYTTKYGETGKAIELHFGNGTVNVKLDENGASSYLLFKLHEERNTLPQEAILTYGVCYEKKCMFELAVFKYFEFSNQDLEKIYSEYIKRNKKLKVSA